MRAITFEQARSQYVHRFTMAHVPQWALGQRVDGTYYAPQYVSDREWYERTAFFSEDELATRKYCHSRCPSWPLGQSLMAPYSELVRTVRADIRCHRENGVSLNPYSTNRARNSWQHGFDGVPMSPLDWRTEYERGALAAELTKEPSCPT